MQQIRSVAQLSALAASLGVRSDWHEPDEQEVSARIVGDHLDNAMGSTAVDNCGEFNVIITREGQDVAVVNLAVLLAFGAGTYRGY